VHVCTRTYVFVCVIDRSLVNLFWSLSQHLLHLLYLQSSTSQLASLMIPKERSKEHLSEHSAITLCLFSVSD
jgi:hypothetical protein